MQIIVFWQNNIITVLNVYFLSNLVRCVLEFIPRMDLQHSIIIIIIHKNKIIRRNSSTVPCKKLIYA